MARHARTRSATTAATANMAAAAMAPEVGAIMACELGWSAERQRQEVETFIALAERYQVN